MHTSTAFPAPAETARLNPDRLGVAASVFCAFHCAAAPVLLLALPSFGRIWAHPATHWGMALFVVPIAAIMTLRGFRKHGRKWILGFATIGILLIIAGSILPYVEIGKDTANGISLPLPGAGTEAATTCTDTCCPSTTTVDNRSVLHIPPAAIVTTLGGIALIITHLGNLCACRSCRCST